MAGRDAGEDLPERRSRLATLPHLEHHIRLEEERLLLFAQSRWDSFHAVPVAPPRRLGVEHRGGVWISIWISISIWIRLWVRLWVRVGVRRRVHRSEVRIEHRSDVARIIRCILGEAGEEAVPCALIGRQWPWVVFEPCHRVVDHPRVGGIGQPLAAVDRGPGVVRSTCVGGGGQQRTVDEPIVGRSAVLAIRIVSGIVDDLLGGRPIGPRAHMVIRQCENDCIVQYGAPGVLDPDQHGEEVVAAGERGIVVGVDGERANGAARVDDIGPEDIFHTARRECIQPE